MANANRSNDGDEDSLLLLSLLSPLPNRSLHCAAAATMLSSPKHTPFHPLVMFVGPSEWRKRKEQPHGGVCGGARVEKVFTYW